MGGRSSGSGFRHGVNDIQHTENRQGGRTAVAQAIADAAAQRAQDAQDAVQAAQDAADRASQNGMNLQGIFNAINATFVARDAAYDARQAAALAARQAANTVPLSAAAQAAIARMTSRFHLHMSWARPFVRDDYDVRQDIKDQLPQNAAQYVTGFHVRGLPDANGFADVDIDYTAPSDNSRPWAQATPQRGAAARAARQRAQITAAFPQTIRVRIIKNQDEE